MHLVIQPRENVAGCGSDQDTHLAPNCASNHAVREAACACIAELGDKIDKACLSEHVLTLLRVLLECFRDESWPVRDAACIACGNFLRCFPAESAPFLDDLFVLFFAHVVDPIWSVREDAAVALGAVVEAYGDEAFLKVHTELLSMLPAAKEQPANSTANSGLANVTQFGVAPACPAVGQGDIAAAHQARSVEVAGGATRIRYTFGTEDPMHTNQQVFSCGSLAPKLKKKRDAGCMDHTATRETEPWERSDGAVYLMRELAAGHPTEVAALMPILAEVAGLDHFTHHYNLLETVWKQLPSIAEGLGKKLFKTHFNVFIKPLYYTLQCTNNLARATAEDCIRAIGKILGPSIVLGRVDQVDDHMSPAFAPLLA